VRGPSWRFNTCARRQCITQLRFDGGIIESALFELHGDAWNGVTSITKDNVIHSPKKKRTFRSRSGGEYSLCIHRSHSSRWNIINEAKVNHPTAQNRAAQYVAVIIERSFVTVGAHLFLRRSGCQRGGTTRICDDYGRAVAARLMRHPRCVALVFRAGESPRFRGRFAPSGLRFKCGFKLQSATVSHIALCSSQTRSKISRKYYSCSRDLGAQRDTLAREQSRSCPSSSRTGQDRSVCSRSWRNCSRVSPPPLGLYAALHQPRAKFVLTL